MLDKEKHQLIMGQILKDIFWFYDFGDGVAIIGNSRPPAKSAIHQSIPPHRAERHLYRFIDEITPSQDVFSGFFAGYD